MERIKKEKKVKKARKRSNFDYTLLTLFIFLIFFGLIMIYSASSYVALRDYKEANYFLIKQAKALGIGSIVFILAIFIPLRWVQNLSLQFYVVSIASLFLVLTPLKVESHNAARWFRIPGVPFNIQPAEIVKFAVIIFIASLFVKMGNKVDTRHGLLVTAIFTLPPVIFIYTITDNLSSAIIVLLIVCAMYFVASANYWIFGILGASGAAGYVLVKMYFSSLDISKFNSFRLERIAAWVDPASQTSDVAYQTVQGLYAIGSGGLMGKGFGASLQKQSFIPEAQNDMIFTIVVEELGIIGGIMLLLLFVFVLWRMQQIASASSNAFNAFLVTGVMMHIAIQVILNIAVVTNLIPNTGVTLPFISYGGSSVVFLMAEVGLVFNASRQIVYKEDEE